MGVPKDTQEAVQWYRKAAAQGYEVAQTSLGGMYEKGTGVSRDFVQAYMWYSLAASRFPASDPVNAAIASEFSKSLAARMAPALVEEAQQLASDWKPTIEAGTRTGRGR